MTKEAASDTDKALTADELAAENERLRAENERLRAHFRLGEPGSEEAEEEPDRPLLVLLLPDPATTTLPRHPDEMLGWANIQRSFYEERNPDWEIRIEHDLDRIPDRAVVRLVYSGPRHPPSASHG